MQPLFSALQRGSSSASPASWYRRLASKLFFKSNRLFQSPTNNQRFLCDTFLRKRTYSTNPQRSKIPTIHEGSNRGGYDKSDGGGNREGSGGWSLMHKFLLGGSAAGLAGYLFTFYMHPEVFEHWVRLIQYGQDSGTTIIPKTQDADASAAFLKLKDPEIRGILDRVSLEEAYAAMDILSCNGACDLSRKSYGAAEARFIFKLLGLMNGSSAERGQITSLRLVNCNLQGRKNSSGKVFKELKDSLGMNRIFRELELRRCNINDAMLLELAEAIKPAVWLTKLDLSENEFGDEGLTAFSQFLRKTTLSLTTLSLVGKQNHRKDGRITDEGAKQLAKAITRSENNTGLVVLRHLDLSNNNLGESGATELLRALGDLQKKNGGSEVSLILLHNNIPDPSKAQLQNLAKTVGVRLDI